MSESENSEKSVVSGTDAKVLSQGAGPWLVHLIVTIILFFIAISVVRVMFINKPEARKFGNRPAPTVAVETTSLSPQNYQVWVSSYGTIEPLTETQLVSDVSGRVVWVSPNIRAGAVFERDEVLVKIDDRDFEIEVSVAESAVADAKVKLQQELAQADVAEKEWNRRPGSDKGKALALRKPQVAAAQASLDAAEAKLAKAKLNLERTQVKAPFKGKVRRQMVDLGQVVNPSQAIADIYSIDVAEVRLPVKASDFAFLNLPEENADYSAPRVIVESQMGRQSVMREGKVVRSEGAFDQNTRMIYVVAQIEQPFSSVDGLGALRVGQFVEAKIEGDALTDVFVLPRRGVSQDNYVSLAKEGVLEKRKVQPLWTDKDNVIVSIASSMGNNGSVGNLTSDDVFILTPTANLPSGTKIRSINEEPGKPSERVAGEKRPQGQRVESQNNREASGKKAPQEKRANNDEGKAVSGKAKQQSGQPSQGNVTKVSNASVQTGN